MNPIASSEDAAHPSKRISIQYKRNGELIKVKVREALYQSLETSKARLAAASGKNFSQSIIARRALDLYLKQLDSMTVERLLMESHRLTSHR